MNMRKKDRNEIKKTRSLVLSDRLYLKAKAIGGGKFTSGVKKALERYDSATALEQFKKDQQKLRSRVTEALEDDVS